MLGPMDLPIEQNLSDNLLLKPNQNSPHEIIVGFCSRNSSNSVLQIKRPFSGFQPGLE